MRATYHDTKIPKQTDNFSDIPDSSETSEIPGTHSNPLVWKTSTPA